MKIKWLKLFREIIGLFWETNEAHKSPVGKIQSYWLKADGTYMSFKGLTMLTD